MSEQQCARIELGIALEGLASHFENALYAFRDDAEALKKAKGDIAHALKIAKKYNQNGPGCREVTGSPGAPVSAAQQAEHWELLAMALAIDEHGDPHQLIYDGNPPEPWGEVWQRYESEAKRMIRLVGETAAEALGSDEQGNGASQEPPVACLRAWVLAEDRLPPPGVEVLVYGPMNLMRWGIDVVKNEGEFFYSSFPNEVSHWMPLPDPPAAPQQEQTP